MPLSAKQPHSRFYLHFCKSVTRDLFPGSEGTKQNLPFSSNRRAETRISSPGALAGNTGGCNFFVYSFFSFCFISILACPCPPSFLHHCKKRLNCVSVLVVSPPPPPMPQHTHIHTCGRAPFCLLCPLIYQAAVDQSLLSSPSALHFALSRPPYHYTNSRPLHCAVICLTSPPDCCWALTLVCNV